MSDRIEGVKKLFTAKSARVETNRGESYYNSLFEQCQARLKELRAQEPVNRLDFSELLAEHGTDRREFMKWVSATTAMLMLPPMFAPLVAEAAELMNRTPVIWIELQDCAGNSEAILRSDGPKIDEIILDIISLEFHETLMAASGYQPAAALGLVFAVLGYGYGPFYCEGFQNIFQVVFEVLLPDVKLFNKLFKAVGPVTVLFQELNNILFECIEFSICFGYIFLISFLRH